MRLIDADALLALIKKRIKNSMIIGWLCSIIRDAPTIDAVPVVRCKECVYFDNITHFCHYHSNYYDGGRDLDRFKDDDFCSYGERKDGDGNG